MSARDQFKVFSLDCKLCGSQCAYKFGSDFHESVKAEYILCSMCANDVALLRTTLDRFLDFESPNYSRAHQNFIGVQNQDSDNRSTQIQWRSTLHQWSLDFDPSHYKKQSISLGNNPTEVSPSTLSETKIEESQSNE